MLDARPTNKQGYAQRGDIDMLSMVKVACMQCHYIYVAMYVVNT